MPFDHAMRIIYFEHCLDIVHLSPAVLSESDDVIHPLLFACETKNLPIVKIALASLQRLIQNKAIPQVLSSCIVWHVRYLSSHNH